MMRRLVGKSARPLLQAAPRTCQKLAPPAALATASAARRFCAPTASDAVARESQLKAEAESWAPPTCAEEIPMATAEEIPVLDLAPYFSAVRAGKTQEADVHKELLAAQLKEINTRIGFMYIVGHGVPEPTLETAFKQNVAFHELPIEDKMELLMDAPGRVTGGVGYMPVGNVKLPARVKPNVNGAFIIKREHGPRDIRLENMPWPASTPDFDGEAFKASMLDLSKEMEDLSMAMLPLYARALGVPDSLLLAAFESPLFRLRASHYPPTPGGEFGINPHVDTTFITLLPTDDPGGLVVYSQARGDWVRGRPVPGSLIVNTGETLQRLTNDEWCATRHYALNPTSGGSRYSIPFFFNPTADYELSVLPPFVSEERPARYPPQSYLTGQGLVQGE